MNIDPAPKLAPDSTVPPQVVVAQATTEYSWTQGQDAVSMQPTAGHICFLTGIGGKFRGGGEEVRVYDEGGTWKLGGQSSQTAVTAWARCIQVNNGYSGGYSWMQGSPGAPMGPADSLTCFLTRVGGEFRGGAERVGIDGDNGSLVLRGTSQQRGVHASARCLNRAPGATYGWGQSEAPRIMQQVATNACFLTTVQGAFEGGAEQVLITTAADYWYLGGHSQQSGLRAEARCVEGK